MKQGALAPVVFLASLLTNAQHPVHFVFKRLPSYHQPTDTIYLAGSFNRWNPGDKRYAGVVNKEKNGITIDLPTGMFEYKFTLGNWDGVEAGVGGTPTENRMISTEKDTTVWVEIDHWTSHFPKKPKETTASKNVHILDSAFYMPQLNRNRRVWIYLPHSYATTKKKYPVLYMHDGQNLFDHATASFGEWGVDEALDTLENQYGEMIVVAVDHGGEKRINEYAPFDTDQFGKGEGNAYVDFLVQTLIPFINNHYRTRKSARFTAIAGSSMGGLISYYALLKYPDRFGAAGVFSPAFWVNPQMKDYTLQRASGAKGRIYFYAGQQESESMVPDLLAHAEILKQKSKLVSKIHIREEGKHSEETWREEFPGFYAWLMESYK